mmetsp:Transcript_26726/g.64973  ORF Transcript_26726/g.64973 Transcript_26726/m.64973 type:complete len:293 (+) Transcript_26726:824-1702(+)
MHVTVSSLSTTPRSSRPWLSSVSVRFFTVVALDSTARRPNSLFITMRRHRMHSLSSARSSAVALYRFDFDALPPPSAAAAAASDAFRCFFSTSPSMPDRMSRPSSSMKRCSHVSGWHDSSTRSSLHVCMVGSALSLPTQYSGLSSMRPSWRFFDARPCCCTMRHFDSGGIWNMASRCASVGSARFFTTSANSDSSSSCEIGMCVAVAAAACAAVSTGFFLGVGTMPNLHAVTASCTSAACQSTLYQCATSTSFLSRSSEMADAPTSFEPNAFLSHSANCSVSSSPVTCRYAV